MSQNILIIQGHPDNSERHFCHVIAEKYASAARDAEHVVEQITIADLEFPMLLSKHDFEDGAPCKDIALVQDRILWANHVVVIYPLWLGDMPALVKAFWEQVLRPKFAFSEDQSKQSPTKRLAGKSARIFVTMGMPAAVYRWFFQAHSVRSLKRNVLSFCGFDPVEFSLIGGVHEDNQESLHVELSKVSHLGRDAK